MTTKIIVDELVQKLSQGSHPLEVILRPEKTVAAFAQRIQMGTLHLKFTDTKGGTELFVTLKQDACDLTAADFECHTGKVKLVGDLTLDYVRVRCTADINLETLQGQGHLEPLTQ